MTFEPENNCYVYVRDLRNGNPVGEEFIFKHKNYVIMYPEHAMTFTAKTRYIPFIKSVLTEEPFIISCYSREFVWVIDDDVWRHPDVQTFGASVSIITYDILGYEPSMPLLPLKGIKYILNLNKGGKNEIA